MVVVLLERGRDSLISFVLVLRMRGRDARSRTEMARALIVVRRDVFARGIEIEKPIFQDFLPYLTFFEYFIGLLRNFVDGLSSP